MAGSNFSNKPRKQLRHRLKRFSGGQKAEIDLTNMPLTKSRIPLL
jgi:hypothetical protein